MKFRKNILVTVVLQITIIFASAHGEIRAQTSTGRLQLTIVDAETGQPTPARVEVLGANGISYIAIDSIPVVGDCGKFTAVPFDGTLEDVLLKFDRDIQDPFTDARHFYSIGESALDVHEGIVDIRVFKGPEYNLAKTKVEMFPNKVKKITIKMSRIANMTEKGWYSADGHLHIPRVRKSGDGLVSKLMQAEDIHVGNLLQMGTFRSFSTARQYAHGPDSHHQEGNYIIASGQENLRTHFLGHTITLGAKEKLRENDAYLLYRLFWEKSLAQGGINGYAHFGQDVFSTEPTAGLPVLLPHNLMGFIEVLQFNQARYDVWYDILNMGFRVAPTAGTDFPCGGVDKLRYRLPGQERFYTKIDGPLTYKSWLNSVKKGKTFVTTGPLLEFQVDGHDIGEEIKLKSRGEVTIEGAVTFDLERDDVLGVNLIENGRVIQRIPRVDDSGSIHFKINHPVDETSWLALRAYGHANWDAEMPRHISEAHTAPIYVTLENSPSLSENPRAKSIAKSWLANLDFLASRLSDENIGYMASRAVQAPGKLIPESQLRLLEEIDTAREFFIRLSE